MRLNYSVDRHGGYAYLGDVFVSQCVIYPGVHGRTIGWHCNYNYKQRGFTKRLVKQVIKRNNIDELVCFIRCNNIASLNLAFSLGFRPFLEDKGVLWLRYKRRS